MPENRTHGRKKSINFFADVQDLDSPTYQHDPTEMKRFKTMNYNNLTRKL